jgi:hypothetical protein
MVECNSNLGFIISLNFLALIITLWAIFGHAQPLTNEVNTLHQALSNSVTDTWVYYSNDPLALLVNPFFWIIALFITIPFIQPIMWGIGDIVALFRREIKELRKRLEGTAKELHEKEIQSTNYQKIINKHKCDNKKTFIGDVKKDE